MDKIIFGFSFLFLCYSNVVVWSRLYKEKIDFSNKFLYLSLLTMFSLGIVTTFFVSAFIRMILNLLLFFFCNFMIYRRKIGEIIVNTLFSEILLTLCDIICALLVMLLFNINANLISDNIYFTSCGNVLTSILYISFAYVPFSEKLYNKLINITKKLPMFLLLIICILVIVSMNYLMATIYYKLSPIIIVLINSILIFVYSFIVYKALDEKNNSMIVKSENTSLMNSLHQYEDMVDRQRVDNHENKNQLLIIKNMIKKKDKDVVKYIDTIVKDQKEDDEALYTRVMTIPSGGLQGIIYQKMLVMKDERIKFSLDVGRGVRDFELEKLSMDDNYRLCKIVGVFLDNAVEESRKIDDKCIMISLYIDDGDLVIDVSNRFKGKIDIDRIDESGYTTKGEGHGYGLSLVKKILSETDRFENVRSVKKDVFKQIIKIKNT